jgi:hypothetical protein
MGKNGISLDFFGVKTCKIRESKVFSPALETMPIYVSAIREARADDEYAQ